MRTSALKKYKKISTHLVQYKGYLGPLSPFFSERSLHPFILGIRDNYYYYNLVQCFPPMKSSLNLLEKLLINKKKIILLNGNKFFYALDNNNSSTSLKKLFFPKYLNLTVLSYDFCSIQRLSNKDIGFIIVQGVAKSAVLESEGKNTPMMGVGCHSLNGISYPFNVNIGNVYLANWYIYLLLGVFRRSLYKSKSKKNEI